MWAPAPVKVCSDFQSDHDPLVALFVVGAHLRAARRGGGTGERSMTGEGGGCWLLRLDPRGAVLADAHAGCARGNRVGTPREVPPPPRGLRGRVARAAWRELATLLVERGALEAVDLPMLALAAGARQRLADAEALVAREGLTVGEGKMLHLHPAAREVAEVARLLRQLYSDLGLSPVGRVRVPVPDPASDETEAEARLAAYGIRL